MPCRLPPAFVVGRAEFVAPFPQAGNRVACSTSYKFTGYERDSETGLDYAFARYYNSRLGRFMSGDPGPRDLSDPQTLNRYAYVRNNPVNLTDPTGMFLCGECQPPPSEPPVEDNLGWMGLIGANLGQDYWMHQEYLQRLIWPPPATKPGPKPAPPPAQAQSPEPMLGDCTKNLANTQSIQTRGGYKGWFADAFLSNSISSGIQLLQDSFRSVSAALNSGWQNLVSNTAIPLAQRAANNVPNVAVSTISATQVSIATKEAQISVTTISETGRVLPFGSLLSEGVAFLGNLANAKTVYDLGISIAAAAVCAVQ